jgi:hypothetical protein
MPRLTFNEVIVWREDRERAVLVRKSEPAFLPVATDCCFDP